MSKTDDYVSRLKPVLDQLANACEELDIPFVALVQIDDNRELAENVGETIIMSSYHIVADRERMARPITDAIMHVLPDENLDQEALNRLN